MRDAIPALLGVIVGAAIPSIASIFQARLLFNQASEDRQERREARLFDLRHSAFVEFQALARSRMDWFAEYEMGLLNGPEPDYDFLEKVYEAHASVRMFGTAESTAAGTELLTALQAFVFKDGGTYGSALAAFDTFAEQARRDLGARA